MDAFGKIIQSGTWEASKSWGHDTSRALFLKKKGVFFKNKRVLLCFLQNLGGTYPQVPPVPTSMDSVPRRLCYEPLFWFGRIGSH